MEFNQKLVLMITNQKLETICNIPIVKTFVNRFGFFGVNCHGGYLFQNSSFAILISETLIDDTLEIYLFNLTNSTRVSWSALVSYCLQKGLLNRDTQLALRSSFKEEETALFLSANFKKLGNLYDSFSAFSALFPLELHKNSEFEALWSPIEPAILKSYIRAAGLNRESDKL